jgi:hypothetical protein
LSAGLPSPSLRTHSDPEPAPDRWELIRDVLVFQLKALLDGVRDLFLIPVSLVAALFDLVAPVAGQGRTFYDVLRLGHRSEEWINLFGAVAPAPERREPGVDRLVEALEQALVHQVQRGGMTATAKSQVDRLLDRIQGGSAS